MEKDWKTCAHSYDNKTHNGFDKNENSNNWYNLVSDFKSDDEAKNKLFKEQVKN